MPHPTSTMMLLLVCVALLTWSPKTLAASQHRPSSLHARRKRLQESSCSDASDPQCGDAPRKAKPVRRKRKKKKVRRKPSQPKKRKKKRSKAKRSPDGRQTVATSDPQQSQRADEASGPTESHVKATSLSQVERDESAQQDHGATNSQQELVKQKQDEQPADDERVGTSSPPAVAATITGGTQSMLTKSATTATRKTKASSSTSAWVKQFLSNHPKDILLPLPLDFLSDAFNLHQLPPVIERIAMEYIPASHKERLLSFIVAHYYNRNASSTIAPTYPIYRQALQRILDKAPSAEPDDELAKMADDVIHHAAKALYLLVHARFVTSPRGLETMRRVLSKAEPLFGRCPSRACHGMPLLPTGASDDCDASLRCQRYCACCGRVWYHWDSKIDGCAWGTSFCHLFLFTYGHNIFPDILKQRAERMRRLQQAACGVASLSRERRKPSNEVTVRPRIYGYPIHPSSPWGLLTVD